MRALLKVPSFSFITNFRMAFCLALNYHINQQ